MKSLLSFLLFSCFALGMAYFLFGIIIFILDDLKYPIDLTWSILGLFLLSIFFTLKPQLKKLSWNDDFIYLFFMTFLKKRTRKHRSLKQKMREELEDEFRN